MTDSREPTWHDDNRGTRERPGDSIHSTTPPSAIGDSRPHRGVVRGHVVTAIGVLRTRIAEPWTLSSLAEEVHLSRSQLVRSFDATVGLSPMACLRRLRVQKMARLLDSTDLSVAATSRAVGWEDANYGSRCFHADYGMSPTQYRRRQIR
jgi:transcriptional regulator GlxA family with amidase domain